MPIQEKQVFGGWTVISRAAFGKWDCRCKCGRVYSVAGGNLKSGHSTCCRICRNSRAGAMRLIDLTGMKFGEWSVVSLHGKTRRGAYMWNCQCNCGGRSVVEGMSLKRGQSTMCRSCSNKITATRHGMTMTKEYKAWLAMRQRCYYPKTNGYHNYGGRGITVCGKWMHSFEAFLHDVGMAPSSSHSMDRIDVNGNYEPSNCRWASVEEQNANKRLTKFHTINGVTKTIRKWSDDLGINWRTVDSRWYRGIRDERLFSKTRISFNQTKTK